MTLKLVIFDVDGTLLDTESIWKSTMVEAGEKFGVLNLGKTVFPKIIGKSGEEEEIILKNEIPYEILDDLVKYWREIGYKKLSECISEKEGVHEIFNYVKKKELWIGVGTATDRKYTEIRLNNINVLKDIDYLVCGDEIKNKKPCPDIYLNICEHFHVDPKEAVVIEDSVVGVEAAYQAGIPCIQVPDIIQPTILEEQHTIRIVNTLLDAIQVIDDIYFK